MRNARFGLADLKRQHGLARQAAEQAQTATQPPAPSQADPGRGGNPQRSKSPRRQTPPASSAPPERSAPAPAGSRDTASASLAGPLTAALGNRRQRQRQRKQAMRQVQDADRTSNASLPPQAGDAPLDPSDIALFRQTMRFVSPMPPVNRRILPPRQLASADELQLRREQAAGDTPQGRQKVHAKLSHDFVPAHLDQDGSSFLRAGLGPDVLRDLRRNRWPITATLDLHGATQDAAWDRLAPFLQSCLAHQIRGVCIVHGKGIGSRDGTPVLKQIVRRWLVQLDAVLAYVECAERDGGSGAVHVLLRQQSDTAPIHLPVQMPSG